MNQNVITSDWIILADMKHDYLFPFQLVLTELHPDILLFSKSSKRAVQLELTCPCEEICSKRLGFNDKIVQKTTKSLIWISMKASLYIYLARNSSGWSSNTSLLTIDNANFPAAGSKNTNPSRDSRNSNTASLSSQPTRNQRKCDQRTKHSGFSNKGNTLM